VIDLNYTVQMHDGIGVYIYTSVQRHLFSATECLGMIVIIIFAFDKQFYDFSFVLVNYKALLSCVAIWYVLVIFGKKKFCYINTTILFLLPIPH
jgi:hypothetical protein